MHALGQLTGIRSPISCLSPGEHRVKPVVLMEKISTIIGLLLSLISLGSAYETFTTIGLWPKLFMTAVAALLLVFGAARWLASYLTPNEAYVGYGATPPRRSLSRYVQFSILLLLASIGCVLLALYLTDRFTLQLNETTNSTMSTTLLIAPEASIDSVTVQLPPKEGASCDWKNRSQEDLPPLTVQMIGWNSPTPQLHVDNFVDPQRIEIVCNPPHNIRSGIIVPARTIIYLADSLRTIQLVVIAIGGLIWLVACFAMWRWSE